MTFEEYEKRGYPPNIQTYGQLLPVDALQRILDRDRFMPGLADADYHLAKENRGLSAKAVPSNLLV